jgi:hypothetical protein
MEDAITGLYLKVTSAVSSRSRVTTKSNFSTPAKSSSGSWLM